MSELDLTFLDEAVERIGRGPEGTIPLLQAIQNECGYLPPEAIERVCEITRITPARIMGVASFYSQFRFTPVGQHMVKVCHGTACHVKGAPQVTDAVREYLGITDPEEDTSEDGLFTVEKVACLGCCTLAPAVQIDEVTYGHLTGGTVGNMITDFLEQDKEGGKKKRRHVSVENGEPEGEILIGLGSCCVARGSGGVNRAVQEALDETGAGARARIKPVGCVGMCHQTPLLEITRNGEREALYAQVTPEQARDAVLKHFRPPSLIRRLGTRLSRSLESLLTDEAWTPVQRYAVNVRDPQVHAFLGPQKHIATEHCGQIDPLSLEEYLAAGGFEPLRRCVTELEPEEIIEQISDAGLRGRGGAGFPTGRKWATVRQQPGGEKYIVCNCDEGDPGAFMDRMLLESFPFRILEGIAIAARAVGAREGVLYIRAEYPLAVQRIQAALDELEARNILGEKLYGTDFSLTLRIMEGAGAFVCGEETALLASIEGERGMPRFRPPYPAVKGLRGKPTLVNNVETYSCVPWILRNGPGAFSSLGAEKSKGTKVFALAGKVARGGLIEVPMGVAIGEIVENVGGGVAGGRQFKAVQIGGPSGGCIPHWMSETTVDFEALTEVGAMMGSGGLVVLDDTDCMVDIARYFLEFTQDQSCGKCTFCRVGTRHMLDILERLCAGQGKEGDIARLEELARQIKAGSLCGLGKTAPNPVLSTLRYFRDEYEAHVEGRCPAGACKDLIRYEITTDCIGCTLCAQACPADAIQPRPHRLHEVDDEKCTRCNACREACPVDAVVVH
ncbi:MAG: NAD(P)H-dependent oxidoreductase subunit E [Planctomycetota bacterium]